MFVLYLFTYCLFVALLLYENVPFHLLWVSTYLQTFELDLNDFFNNTSG